MILIVFSDACLWCSLNDSWWFSGVVLRWRWRPLQNALVPTCGKSYLHSGMLCLVQSLQFPVSGISSVSKLTYFTDKIVVWIRVFNKWQTLCMRLINLVLYMYTVCCSCIVPVAVLLWPPYAIGGPLYFCPVISIYLLSFFFFPRLISAVGDWMFTILWLMVWP